MTENTGNTATIKRANSEIAQDVLGEVFSLLRAKCGHDFSRYKPSTVTRRIQRRVQVTHCNSPEEYVDKLRSDPNEAENLFNELLIGVTQFFRNPESFEVLRAKALTPLIFEKDSSEAIRIWVPGCATGEEAFSIAMLLSELTAETSRRPHIQIFATDLDAEALHQARRAWFGETVAETISPARLAQFFRPVKDGYEVNQEIREMCIFSSHNLLKDPPFSRVDLISCRNLLIYLESDAQKKLLQVFHYALNPSGYLFLGTSENIASRSDYFRPIDTKHRIFERSHMPISRKEPVAMVDGVRFTRLIGGNPVPSRNSSTRETPLREQGFTRSIERLLIEEYTPASVIINSEGDVIYSSGKVEKFLRAPAGAPTTKLSLLVRKAIRLEVRAAIHSAVTAGEEIVRDNIAMPLGDEVHSFNLRVKPLNELAKNQGYFIVLFEEITSRKGDVPIPAPASRVDESVLRQLEDELLTTKEELQDAIEEVESSNEELKSANEELLSMNEELQSANEELQTSKEEIQAANDELQAKVEEVDSVNEELHSTLERIGDAFVAFDLRWRYTFINNKAKELIFKLRPGEEVIGKCVWDLFPSFVGTEVYTQMHRAMDLQTTASFEMSYGDLWLSIRVHPSKDGISLYIQNDTERKLQEQANEEQAALDAIGAEIGRHLTATTSVGDCLQNCAQSLVNNLDAAFARFWLLDHTGTILELKASAGLYTHINGGHAQVPVGKFKIGLIAAERKPHLTNEVIGDSRVPEQEWARREGLISFAGYPIIVGERLIGVMAMFARHTLSANTLKKMSAVADLVGIGIERARSAENLQRSEDRFRSLVHATSQIVWTTNAAGEVSGDSSSWNAFTGQSEDERNGLGWINAIHPDDRENVQVIWKEAFAKQAPFDCEYRLRRADGEYRWTEVRAVPVLNDDSSIREWVGTNIDITDKKQAEDFLERTVAERTTSLRETIGELEAFSYSVSHDLRSPLRAMQGYANALIEDCHDKLSAEQQGFLDRIARGAGRLDRLTLDVLAYSRVSRTEYQAAPVHLEKLIMDVLEQYPQFEPFKPNIQIVLPLHPVLGHEAFLTQCVSNLIGNAVKFVPKDTTPCVRIWTEILGENIRLCVKDNGIGIAPEHADRVFQLFGRVYHERQYEGTGIGLAVVRKAAEKMGGCVGFESETGKGSVFWIQLPKTLNQ